MCVSQDLALQSMLSNGVHYYYTLCTGFEDMA